MKSRILLSAGVAMALAIGALGAPAGAAGAAEKGRLIIVQGRPGPKTELCINKREIKSTFKYGGSLVRWLNPGKKVIKLRRTSAGTCAGRILATKKVKLASGDDRVVVFTKYDPKVVAFNRPPLNRNIVLRHTADFGLLGFRYEFSDNGMQFYRGADISAFGKGQWGAGAIGDFSAIFWAHPAAGEDVIGKPFAPKPPTGKRHEAIMVGTSPKNARWIHTIVGHG